MLEICICTYNPRIEVLKKVLGAICNQSSYVWKFRVLIVDNASEPPLENSLIDQFEAKGMSARIVRESVPGIARARLRAVCETKSQWLLFVDDDNELAPNYVGEGIKFALMHKNIGCFGGKLLLAPALNPSKWIYPFLSRLAIKDAGDEVIIGKSESWEIWEPPTAGAFIKRPVLELYRQRVESNQAIFQLGRVGTNNLVSCEDSFMMRLAYSLNLATAYNPNMVLYHHLDEKRFKFKYLMRLMFSYGISHVRLEALLNNNEVTIPDEYRLTSQFLKLILKTFKGAANQSLAFGIGIAAYHLGARSEYFRPYQK
ncbi:glycosyltransferase [Methylomonas sp. MgM2]